MLLEDTYTPGNPQYGGSDLLVVLTGCSGSGKSTLLNELASRGYEVRPEAGRQVVKEQLAIGDDGVPWGNMDKFMNLSISRAMYLFNTAAPTTKPLFFDRSILDALAHLHYLDEPVPEHLKKAAELYRYGKRVFMTPPWAAIFVNDKERRHSFDEAADAYALLETTYEAWGYHIILVPKLDIAERADFVEEHLKG